MVEDMDPRLRDFLKDACGALKRYDRDGEAVIPISAWGSLLDDLQLHPEDELANTLADFMQGVGEGFISYEPLLEALGAMPLASFEMLSNSGSQAAASTDAPAADCQSSSREQSPPPRGGPPMHPVTGAFHEEEGSSPPASPQDMANGHKGLTELDPADLEDVETFWARRGGTVQRLYQLWDCNQLENEQFSKQLQDLLGARVDIKNADSAFARLINKHRNARSMKFAELTSALRHDARSTAFKRFGHGTAPSSYAPSSYAGSIYEATAPSEAGGSEAPWGIQPGVAAGRPTSEPKPNSLGSAGRRHFHGDVPTQLQRGAAPIPSECGSERRAIPRKGRAPYAYGDGGAGDDDAASAAGYPSAKIKTPATVPRAAERTGLQLGHDFWDQRRDAAPRQQFDTASQVESVADSQLSHFTHRNRHGHGNILTWGADESRTITPERKRGGRQLALDEEKGVLRSQVTAGVFPQRGYR